MAGEILKKPDNIIIVPFGRGAEMYHLYNEGYSFESIGRHFGVSAKICFRTIVRHIQWLNWKILKDAS